MPALLAKRLDTRLDKKYADFAIAKSGFNDKVI